MFLSISLLDYLHSQINPVPLSYLHGLDDLEATAQAADQVFSAL